MIPHNKPSLDNQESEAIAEVIASGWIAKGKKVAQFEREFAEYVGTEHAIAVNSGTAALYIALKILGIDHQGYNIYTSTYCCAAVINAIRATDGHCELMDIDKSDFNITNIDKIDHHEAHAVIVPHTFGVPVEIKKSKYRRPYIIEDCSQALGSYIDSQHVGLRGDIGIFSFGPSKMITTGSGGMLVTNNKNLADKSREFIDYDKHIPAFNFAMNDIQAAMGLVQLKKLPEFLHKRECMAREYIKCILDTQKYWMVQESNFNKRNWCRFVIIDECVQRLQRHLADNGITAIVPIEKHELLHNTLGIDSSGYTNAEYVATHSLSLPIYPDLYNNGFKKILDALRCFE
jgi:perosamine synthetase